MLTVVIVDRIIPAKHEPALLYGVGAAAAGNGRSARLESLPTEVADYIDWLKREPGL
jgi:hypothetical protein